MLRLKKGKVRGFADVLPNFAKAMPMKPSQEKHA